MGDVVPIRPGAQLLNPVRQGVCWAREQRWELFSGDELAALKFALMEADEFGLYDEVARESTRRNLNVNFPRT